MYMTGKTTKAGIITAQNRNLFWYIFFKLVSAIDGSFLLVGGFQLTSLKNGNLLLV
jgi:hypothetical protein